MKVARSTRLEILCFAAVLAALNFYFCRELFRTEYLDNFQSNEGILVQLAHFLRQHAGAKWYPYWNVGLPIENTYEPVVPVLIALLSLLTPISPPLALHVLCGTFLCLIPVAWCWLLWRWGVSARCVFAGGLLYSLVSPSMYWFHGAAGLVESRRVTDVAFWGDIAHMIATGFLPLALFAIERAIRTGRTRYFLMAVLCSALTSLSDQFGITALSFCTIALVASLPAAETPRGAARALFIGAATYLSVGRVLTPAVLAIVSKNSQLLGADYRFTLRSLLGWSIVVAGAAVVVLVTRRASLPVRFMSLMAWIFTSMYALWLSWHIPVLPVTERYGLEVDLSLCLLAAIAVWKLPRRFRLAILAAALIAAVPQAVRVRQTAQPLLKAVDVHQTVEYRSSKWIASNLPGLRIMVGGAASYWFDYWTDNPQLSGGHDGLAPNFMQRVATFTIYSGENAGTLDAADSIFWMKAYGVSAIYVAGAHSPDKIHPFVHPEKFAGVLPVLWQDGDSTVYSSGRGSGSLAHIIPASAVVMRQPMHGLDTAPAEAYVRAIDDPSLPSANLKWVAPDRGRISGNISPGQVVAVQVTYDPGWVARQGGKRLSIKADGLDMMVIEPEATGPAAIDLEFEGGTQRTLMLAISGATILSLCLWGLAGAVRNTREKTVTAPPISA
jgi:hypothetical protein